MNRGFGLDDPLCRQAQYVIETSQPDYLRAFSKWIRDPMTGHYAWTPKERDAHIRVTELTRALSLSNAGTMILPYQLDPQILIANAGAIDPMRDVARVERTVQNEARFLTSAGVTGSWDAEAAEVSDDSPTLPSPRSLASPVGCSFRLASRSTRTRISRGRSVNCLPTRRRCSKAPHLPSARGTAQPWGVVTRVSGTPGSVVTEAAGAALTAASVFNNQAALPPRYRANARWMANLTILNQARALPIGAGLNTALYDGGTMLGWSVHENSAMDATFGAGNDYVLLSRDFRNYIITDRLGASLEFVQNLFGASGRPTGQRGFLMHWRTGGDCVIADAFRITNFSA
jgi:predicted phage gp36 major capsid-like protein